MMSKICIPVPLLLLLLLPAVCEGSPGQLKFSQHYYKTTWEDARAYCRSKGTDLVTIREDDRFNLYDGYGWIGLYQKNSNSEWKWSKGDETAWFPWEISEPEGGENCGHKMIHSYAWRSSPCDKRKAFMCHEETLVLVNESKTWEEALEHCRALEAVDPSKPATAYQNHRYDLASLLTPEDQIEARERMNRQASTDEVWTGLRYLAGQWFWVGGEEVQYQGLDTCPSVRLCGVLNKNREALYDTRQCFWKKNFLCYRKR